MSLFVCLTLQKEENKIHHELRHHPPYLAIVQPVHLSISMSVRNCIFKRIFRISISVGVCIICVKFIKDPQKIFATALHRLLSGKKLLVHRLLTKDICQCTGYYPGKMRQKSWTTRHFHCEFCVLLLTKGLYSLSPPRSSLS